MRWAPSSRSTHLATMAPCPRVCGSQSRSSPFWSSLLSWCSASSDHAAAESGSTRPPAQTLPHRSTDPVDTPPLRASRSHNRQHLPRPRRPQRRHRSALTPAGCPPSATTPPSRVTRRNVPSPTFCCPSRQLLPPNLRACSARGSRGDAGCARHRGGSPCCARRRRHRADRGTPGAAARAALEIAERAGPQHARPARGR